MTQVFNKSLMIVGVAITFALAQSLTSVAQVGDGEALATLNLDTGEIVLELGSGLQVFGITGVPFDNAAAAPNLLAIDPLPSFNPDGETQGRGTQNDEQGIAVLNTAFLPSGVFNLGPVLQPETRTVEAISDFMLLFDGPGAPINAGQGFTVGTDFVTVIENGSVLDLEPPTPTPPTPPTPPTTPTPPLAPTDAVGEAQVFVDLSTGELFIEIGAGLQVFELEGVPFDSAAATAGLLAIDPISAFEPSATQGPGTINDERGIGVLNTSFLPTGLFNLGAIIFEDFRSEVALADLIFRFDGPGNTDPMAPNGDPANITFNRPRLLAIPEPSPFSLLVLAGMGAFTRRRR